ncbi:MAG: hypothetical protein Tsb009_04130 [Planctomycetaceae bacterium]
MRTILFSLFSCGISLVIVGDHLRADPPVEKRVLKPIRPLPVPVRQKFQLRVQKISRFPRQLRPAASKPASKNGLEVTIQPEKKSFPLNSPLAFEVKLTNRSKQGMLLFGVDGLGVKPKLVVANLKNANQWSIQSQFDPARKNGKSIPLMPGKSLTLYLVAESSLIPRPGPIPIPRPRKPSPFLQIRQGRPIIRPPIPVNQNLPCGQGKCRARLFLEFQQNPDKRRFPFPHWVGKLASESVDFQVGKPEPIFVPGQPLTKDRAIKLAYPVAERALRAHYKPIENIRPPHPGPWIESPEKTAIAKKSAAGVWTVSWTHFPKAGHGYNVKVEVFANGLANLRDVFTSYSRAK